MNWIEVCVYTTTEATEAVSAALAEAGAGCIVIDDPLDLKNFLKKGGGWDYIDEELLSAPDGEACIKFYVSDNAHGRENLMLAKRAVMRLLEMDIGLDLGRLCVETEIVNDEDWLNNWKKYYKPLAIGQRLIIRPEWEAYEGEDKIVITLNPGHVFGTGLHQSTQLCMEQLENIIKGGESVLDLGCGSGVLSITAKMLGAQSALAVDIDSNAVDIAYENAKINGVADEYRVLSGDAVTNDRLREDICSQKYGIVTANIVADVIIALTSLVEECTHPGGLLITSGIIRERTGDVLKALAHGFEVVSETVRDEWVCIVGMKKQYAEIFR